jgi:hypothetical protein
MLSASVGRHRADRDQRGVRGDAIVVARELGLPEDIANVA